MKKKLLIAILFILYSSNLMALQQHSLAPNPVWLKEGKAFSKLDNNEIFYFVKFKEQIEDSNKYLIAFLVYSYSPLKKTWTVWSYDKTKKDFYPLDAKRKLSLTQVHNLFHSKGPKRYDILDIEKMYKIYLWSNSNILSFLKEDSLDFLIFSKNFSIKKDKYSLKKEELNSLRMINYKSNIRQYDFYKGVKQAVYFDDAGYGYFNFNNKPDEEINKDEEEYDEEIPDLSPPYSIITNKKEYFLFPNYGYVYFNCFFYSNNINYTKDYKLFITKIHNNDIFYSPLLNTSNYKYYFYIPSYKNDKLHLWKESKKGVEPLGELKHKRKNEFIFEKVFYSRSLISQAFNNWMVALNSYTKLNLEQKKLFIQKFCKSNTAFNAFNDFMYQYKIKAISFFDEEVIFPSNSDIIKIDNKRMFYKEPSGNWSISGLSKYIIRIQIPKNDYVKTLKIKLNDYGYTGLYSKTHLYDTKEWYYQELTRIKQEGRLKKWVIIDDYVDPDALISKTLFEFKNSFRLKQILFQEKAVSRIDLLKGLNIINKNTDDRTILSSSYSLISDLKALLKLKKHQSINQNDYWELHLFLARNTSGYNSGIINPIAKKLKDLRVKRIIVWEFCDNEPYEITFNDNLFKEISEIGKFEYSYKSIFSKTRFYSILK